MNKYRYRALTADSIPQRGEIEAVNEELAMAELRNRQLFPVDIRVVKEPVALENIFRKNAAVPQESLVVFSRQLATMVNAGMTLLNSLITLEEQQAHPRFKSILSEVSSDVETGKSFTEALRKHPETFDNLYTAMVQAGEASGSLELSLLELARQLEATLKLKRKISAATKYPKVVGIAAVVICSGLLIFIVPKFAEIFLSLAADAQKEGKTGVSGDLPMPTRIVLAGSHLLYPPDYTGGALVIQVIARFIGLAALYAFIKFAFNQWRGTEKGRRQWDGLKLRAPMKIGPIVQKIAVARFARTFSTLSSSGVPVLVAFDIVGQTAGNAVVEDAVNEAKTSLSAGSSIAAPLSEANIFPPMVTKMIAVGEESGSLDVMLSKIADFYEEEVEIAIDGLTSIIEPLMIMVIGAMIGVIVIAIYLPLFSVYNLVG